MKLIANMSERERSHLIMELEREHRVAVVEAAKVKRDITSLSRELARKQGRVHELEEGIAALRGD